MRLSFLLVVLQLYTYSLLVIHGGVSSDFRAVREYSSTFEMRFHSTRRYPFGDWGVLPSHFDQSISSPQNLENDTSDNRPSCCTLEYEVCQISLADGYVLLAHKVFRLSCEPLLPSNLFADLHIGT